MAMAIRDPWTLDQWLRQNWAIVPDPPEAEYIRSPVHMVQCRLFQGDCDDAATLAASVLTALGYPVLLVATRQHYETDFSHVFARVPLMNLDIDPIVPPERMPISYAEAMVLLV
jgi:hypothetical protein